MLKADKRVVMAANLIVPIPDSVVPNADSENPGSKSGLIPSHKNALGMSTPSHDDISSILLLQLCCCKHVFSSVSLEAAQLREGRRLHERHRILPRE